MRTGSIGKLKTLGLHSAIPLEDWDNGPAGRIAIYRRSRLMRRYRNVPCRTQDFAWVVGRQVRSTGLKRVYKGFTKGLHRVYKGFTKGKQRVYKGFTKGLQRVYKGFTKGLQRVNKGFTKGEQRVYKG
jgi:hypothetical protein